MKPTEVNAHGTSFYKGSSKAVIAQLEWARYAGVRIRVFYGDTKTGRDWGEENETIGYVGRTTGAKKMLILVHNARSLGGGLILTDCIVKIISTTTGEVLYQHPKYSCPVYRASNKSDLSGYQAIVTTTGPGAELYARCKTLAQAERLAAFMMGKRHSK